MKETKAESVLWFIRDAGKEGRSYSDIQRFVCGLNGKDYDALSWDGRRFRRRYRGYWSTNLQVLLPKFCTKLPGRKGKWVSNGVPRGPFFTRDASWARGLTKHMNEHHKKPTSWAPNPRCWAPLLVETDFAGKKGAHYSVQDINNSNGLASCLGEWHSWSEGRYRRRHTMLP